MKLLADYQSAKEQTAIRAGDGGFHINVNGDTRLDGAVMNSTAASNTLTTQTLKLTDLENKENVSGSSSNLTLSYTNPKVATGNFGGTTYGFADIDRSSLSHTKAAIVAGATLNITRPDLQTQSVASLNRDVNAAHQPLTPTFDARQATAELETGAATMAAFTRAGYEFAGSYSQDQIKKSDDLRKLAGDSTLPAAVRDQYLAEADQLLKTWGNGGVGRAALHALVGGAAWGSVGALASAGNVLSEPYRDTAVDAAMRAVGLDPSTNPGLKNTLMFASSTALGSALGGAQGAAATFSADANNRQLHPIEADLIKQNARRFAKVLFTTEIPTDDQVKTATALMASTAEFLLNYDSKAGIVHYNKKADEFLSQLKIEYMQQNDTLTIGGDQKLFYASEAQRANVNLNAGLADPAVTNLILRTPLAVEINNPKNSPQYDSSRDRMTGLPLDSSGRYTVSVAIEGKIYSPKYFSCGDTYCTQGGYSLDKSDAAGQEYLNALTIKGLSDLQDAANTAIVLHPLGLPGRVAGATGTAAELISGVLKDEKMKAFGKIGLQEAAEQYMTTIYRIPEAAAKRIIAITDLMGGWDIFAEKAEDEIEK